MLMGMRFRLADQAAMSDPRLLAAMTVLLWSSGMTLGRLFSLASPYVLFTLSLSVAAILTVTYARVVDRRTWRSLWEDMDRRFLIFGPLGYLVYWIGVTESFRAYDTVSEPTVLNYTFPVFTVLFTELLFRRGRRKAPAVYAVEGAGVALGVLATVVMVSGGKVGALSVLNVPGLLWGLLGGASYGLFSAFSGTLPERKSLAFLASASGLSAIGMLLLSIPHLSEFARLTWQDLLLVAAMGGVLESVGYFLWTRANRLASERNVSIASVASVVYFLPVLSLMVASVVFSEATILRPYFALALAFLMAGSWICQRSAQPQTAGHSEPAFQQPELR